jgi:phosphopantetheinyl transferase (holo-ACP synthase)
VARVRTAYGDRELLAALLLPGWPGSARIGHDTLGRPLCPSLLGSWNISLSRVPDSRRGPLTYGAVCRVPDGNGACGFGIDAAVSADFDVNYPMHRVFHDRELALLSAFDRDIAEDMALAWAGKEAAVKALGIGFHYADPLDIEICSCREEAGDVQMTLSIRVHGTVHALECLAWSEDDIWVAACAVLPVS